MGQSEIKILSCRGISPSAEGRSMLNTRRTRMPKRKNGTRTGADDAHAVGLSGNIRYGIRGYEERVIGHDDRRSPEGRIFSGFLVQEVRRVAHVRYYTYDTLASLENYNARNKILVKPLCRSVNSALRAVDSTISRNIWLSSGKTISLF